MNPLATGTEAGLAKRNQLSCGWRELLLVSLLGDAAVLVLVDESRVGLTEITMSSEASLQRQKTL